MLPAILGLGSAGLYATSATLLYRRLSKREKQPKRGLVLFLAGLAALLHAWLLSQVILTPAGVDLNFFNALSLAGWLITTIMLIIAIRQPVENLGIGLFPATALIVCLELGFSDPHTISGLSLGVQLHILFSVTAYGMLALAATQSLLLAFQNARLHKHQPGGLIRALPPLALMESLLFQMIGAGFALLSLSLLTGFLYVDDLFAQRLVHKTVLSIGAWLFFATLLSGRQLYGWRGKVAVRWTLSGFGLLLLGYFGSKLVMEMLLSA